MKKVIYTITKHINFYDEHDYFYTLERTNFGMELNTLEDCERAIKEESKENGWQGVYEYREEVYA